jgi:2-polyprenyl-3-methyl-5-hydroxy-6-metoxy-1,4-benzoquinol methylase
MKQLPHTKNKRKNDDQKDLPIAPTFTTTTSHIESQKQKESSARPIISDYWESRLEENFGLHGTGYIGLGREYNNLLYKVRRNVFLRKMKSMHIDFTGSDVLDIGCGTGFYVDLWNKIGVRTITGIDITNIAVRSLKSKYPGQEFYRADISNQHDIENLNAKKYDIVSAFDILFHIVDDKKYDIGIKHICSVLKPNGIFIFSDNFIHGPAKRSTYQVSRSLTHIEKTLTKNGFKIMQRCPMFVLMNTPVDTTRTVSKKMWKVLSLTLQKYGDTAGLVIGGILYPLEIMLASLLKESAST